MSFNLAEKKTPTHITELDEIYHYTGASRDMNRVTQSIETVHDACMNDVRMYTERGYILWNPSTELAD